LVVFYYAALGVGLSVGVKLPKIGRVQLPGATGSLEAFTSMGQVYMSGHFHKPELSVDDISGGCCFLEVGGGVAWGAAGYAMVFGMNTAHFIKNMLGGGYQPLFADDGSTGMLVFGGMNYGLQGGAGITSFAGILTAAD
jgi:hypothetical protein